MNKKWLYLIVLIIPVVGVIFSVSYKASRGTGSRASVAVGSEGYQRIVSMAPSITEIIYSLGMGNRVVGVTDYCMYPPEVMSKPVIGGYYNPNYETLIRLAPDLVILLPEHEKPREYLNRQGIETLTVDQKTIAGIFDSIRRIGDIGGVPERAAELEEELRNRVSVIAEKTAKLPAQTVMITVGRDFSSAKIENVFIVGAGIWHNELITLAGGANVYTGDMAFPAVSAEGIMSLNPEVIIEMIGQTRDSNPDPVRIARAWQTMPRLAAVQNNRVHVMTEGFAVIPGPRFILVLEEIARLIHPDVDWDDGTDTGTTPEASECTDKTRSEAMDVAGGGS